MPPNEEVKGCVAAAAGPMIQKGDAAPAPAGEPQEEMKMHVTVGQEAPDFEAAAYHQGGFQNIKLSDFRGKWVFLCFYPGDFTFV